MLQQCYSCQTVSRVGCGGFSIPQDACNDDNKHAVTVMVCKAAARFWALTAALQIWIRNGCRTWTSTLVGSLQVPMLLVMLFVLQQSQTQH
jgi:hypothetical protein